MVRLSFAQLELALGSSGVGGRWVSDPEPHGISRSLTLVEVSVEVSLCIVRSGEQILLTDLSLNIMS